MRRDVQTQACNYDLWPQLTTALATTAVRTRCFPPRKLDTASALTLFKLILREYLAGLSTYRVYINTPNTDDVLTAVTGSD